jgi:hypothetical protein
LAAKIRWASKQSTTAEQARNAADALIAAGYKKYHPEAVGEVEVIGPETTRVGSSISHKGVIYREQTQ